MITPQRRNELGDELEINLMKDKVVSSVLPNGMDFKHIPKTSGGPDFEIIDKQTREVIIVIECKNWDIIPSDKQIETEIIDRFKKYRKNELKYLVGHVNFTKEQKEEYLIKNKIVYDDLESQILPEDIEYKKQEFEEKLKSSLASILLFHLGRYRPDLVSDMKVEIIGDDELLFKVEDFQRRVRLSTKKFLWFKRENITASEFRRVGPKPLDIIMTIKGEDKVQKNIVLVPRKYDAYSKNVKFESGLDFINLGQRKEFNKGIGIEKFFRGVLWKADA